MNRETAIRTGLDLMTKEYGIDASAVMPKFVHILYDSDNGMIDDEEIYAGSEEEEIDIQYMAEGAMMLRSHLTTMLSEIGLFIAHANIRAKKAEDRETDTETEECSGIRPFEDDEKLIHFLKEKEELISHLDEVELCIRKEEERMAEKKEDATEVSRYRFGIADEWMEDNEDGTFDRYAMAASREGKGILLKLTLVEDEDGDIDIAYMRVD